MKIAVVVHHPHSEHALGFVRAALAAAHDIPLVFFYHEGVHAGVPDGAGGHHERWAELHEAHGLRLCVCIGAASRRGLVGESGARDEHCRLDARFEIAGLGQLVGAMMESDRLITFSD